MQSNTLHPVRFLSMAVLTALLTIQGAPLLAAEQCPPTDKTLLPEVPEIVSDPVTHRLQGTILLGSQSRLLCLGGTCAPQTMRYFDAGCSAQGQDAVSEPLPGPTLRARVGDTVELTFVNQIDPRDFPQSIDRGEQGYGCDQTRSASGPIYPENTGDQSPDCFHGSSTANLHFHGTHTSPSTTADNVLIQVRPSPYDSNDQPTITPNTFRQEFDTFFKQCEAKLDVNEGSTLPIAWPTRWEQLPAGYREKQEALLKAYDKTAPYQGKTGLPKDQQLWPQNRAAIADHVWPQYYLGAYPYCFKLPAYREASWPPKNPSALQMGQAPGTHWYHAHKHGSTAINVSNGMAGAFIIEGDYDDKIRGFYKSGNTPLKEQVLEIQQLGVTPNLERGGGPGPSPLSINGRLAPTLTMRAGEVQLWRVLNTASRSSVALAFPTGFDWRQTAQDGVQLAPANYSVSNQTNPNPSLASGNRADFLVKAPTQPGDFALNNGQTALLNIHVTADAGAGPMAFPIPDDKFPKLPVFLTDITDQEIRIHRELVFNTEGGTGSPTSRHMIDGKLFSNTVAQAMLQGTAEEWKVINMTTGVAHPFHIHINPFQITEVFSPNATVAKPGGGSQPLYVTDPDVTEPKWINGQCHINANNPTTWAPCAELKTKQNFVWWDVFAIPTCKPASSGSKVCAIPGYFKMRSRFEDYSGQFVLHCHILAHEDRGMMQLIEVVPSQPALSHH